MRKRNTKKKIMEFMSDMQWLFECGNFDRIIVYPEKDKDHLMAEMSMEEDYQRIKLTIYPTFFKEREEDQRKALLHELSHIFTIPLSCIGKELLDGKFHSREEICFAHERAASKIENVLDALLQGRFKYAKKAYEKYLKP